jgi:hypothetical protein
MLSKFLVAATLSVPLIAFAEPNANAFAHANQHASFQHAPEIDGTNVVLGITLLGGIISLIVRRKGK